MAQIKIGPSERTGTYELLVDGVDLSLSIMKDGFTVDFSGDLPVVGMRIVADAVDIDLPEAVIKATREPDEPRSLPHTPRWLCEREAKA